MKSKEEKRAEAVVRQQERLTRTTKQQLAKFGVGQGAKKERIRLQNREDDHIDAVVSAASERAVDQKPVRKLSEDVDALVASGGAPSRSAARRAIEQGKKPGSPKGDPANHRLRATASE
jgi:predicted dinucleotide-utilizing enzyme